MSTKINYFDRLPSELVATILNAAADKAELGAFEVQEAVINQREVEMRWKEIKPRSNEYAVRSKVQVDKLVSTLLEDSDRGNQAMSLVVDFSQDGSGGRGPSLAKLLDLMPMLKEVDLRAIDLHSRHIDDWEGGFQAYTGLATHASLMKLGSIEQFIMSPTFEPLPIGDHLTSLTENVIIRDIPQMFAAWPKLKRLDISAMVMYYASLRTVDIPNVPPLTHLSLRVNGVDCQNLVADVVRRSISTLTHLELYSCNRVEIWSILSSRPVKLRHLICLDRPRSFRPPLETWNYLDTILRSLVELRSIALSVSSYTSFSFIEKLPRLRDIVIVVDDAYNFLVDINRLFLDLESRLSRTHQLSSINISIHTRFARMLPQDQLSPLHLLSKACKKFGIKFKVHVFDVDGDSNYDRRHDFQVAAAKRR